MFSIPLHAAKNLYTILYNRQCTFSRRNGFQLNDFKNQCCGAGAENK